MEIKVVLAGRVKRRDFVKILREGSLSHDAYKALLKNVGGRLYFSLKQAESVPQHTRGLTATADFVTVKTCFVSRYDPMNRFSPKTKLNLQN